jgi:hypothetical protein
MVQEFSGYLYSPTSALFKLVQYISNDAKRMLSLRFELTPNQSLLQNHTRQTRGLQSISETPASYQRLTSLCGL